MYHSFPYSAMFSPLLIPDDNLQGIYEYPKSQEIDDIYTSVKEALENPIGTPKLEILAKNKKSALIIADDLSRKTPVKQIIPILCEKLEEIGVPKIKILIAMGAGKPLTVEEKKAKFGSYIFDKYDIINHRYKDHLDLVDLGYNSFGSRLYVNNHLLEADLIVGLGQITPHRIAGFSGGSEIILPGVSGAESIAKINWDSALLPTQKVFGVVDNPIREEMDDDAKRVNLSFIINCIPNPQGKICHIVAGSYKDAFREGCKLCEKVYGANFLHKSDITVVDSYPKDQDLWHASRALFAAELMTKPTGAIIFISPCHNGVSQTHKFITEYGYKSEQETLSDFEEGKIPSMTIASHLIRMGRITKDKYKCYMVHNAIPPYLVSRLGFEYVKTPQEALNKAFFVKGNKAVVSVLKNGGETLPIHILREHYQGKNNYF